MAGTLVANQINTDTGLFSTNNAYSGIAKAWVNFVGSSGAVNNSFNVSSVTRSSLGTYVVNFVTAMPNANYVVATSSTSTQGSSVLNFMTTNNSSLPTTTTCSLVCVPSAGGNPLADPTQVYCTIFSS